MRIAIGIEYEGASFCGWQSQPDGCGLQDHLERAIGEVADGEVSLVAAGRTDTGVHATLQVAHFDTGAARPISAWVRGVNSRLHSAIAVRWGVRTTDDFHARFSATSRAYTYVLLNRAPRPGLLKGRVGWHHKPLDLEAMRAGAQMLAGRHDFSAFRSADCQAKTPVRTLQPIEIAQSCDLVVFRFRADGFLHHMVRNIVGALVYVGNGRWPPSFVGDVLAGRNRGRGAPTFAPDGLYLTGVDYPARFGLPEAECRLPLDKD